jgi:tetratricopeptide (TPR) repeat protein
MGIFDFFKQDYNTCKVCGEQISSDFEICNDCKSVEGSDLRVHIDQVEDIGVVTHYQGKPFTGVVFNDPKPWFKKIEFQMKNGLKDGFHKHLHNDGGYTLSEYKNDSQIGTVKGFNKEGKLIWEHSLEESKKNEDELSKVLKEVGDEIKEISKSNHDYQIASDYEESGKYKLAMEHYTKSIKKDPYHVDSYVNRGRIYEAVTGQLILAIDDYTKAINIDPDDVMIYYNRGIVFAKLKRFEDGKKDFIKAIKIDPNYASGTSNFLKLKKIYHVVITDGAEGQEDNATYAQYGLELMTSFYDYWIDGEEAKVYRKNSAACQKDPLRSAAFDLAQQKIREKYKLD